MQAIEHLNKISNGYRDALGFQQAYIYTSLKEHQRYRKIIHTSQTRCSQFRVSTYNYDLEVEDTLENRAYLYAMLLSQQAPLHGFSTLCRLDQYRWQNQDLLELLTLPECRWHGLFAPTGVKYLASIFKDVNSIRHDPDWLKQNTHHRATLTTLGKPLPYAVQRQIDKEPKGPQLPIKRRPFPWDSLRERKGRSSVDHRQNQSGAEDSSGLLFSFPQDQALIQAIKLQNT